MNRAQRPLTGVLSGGLAGAIAGPLAGAFAGIVMDSMTIFLMGPLYLPNIAMAAIPVAFMLLGGPIIGVFVGLITAAINRHRFGWAVGLLAGVAAGAILAEDVLAVAVGGLTGSTAAMVVERRLRVQPAVPGNPQARRHASAD